MSSRILYEQWLGIARAGAAERALYDGATGRAWSYRELLAEGERSAPARPVAFLQGHGPEFIFALLRSWRAGSVTCPLEAGQPTPAFFDIPPEGAHVKLTSATSGPARSVLFTAPQLAADAANIVSTMGLRPDWPNLACISLAHSYGFSNLVLPLLLHGIPLILAPAPLPEIVRSLTRDHPAVTLPAVPALWKVWHTSKAILPGIKLAISAGAPLPLPLEQAVFDSCGLKLHNFYGSSECGGIAYDRSAVPRPAHDLAGTALNNVLLTISGSGTLVVEGAAVGERYWPEKDPSLQRGRFETPDLATILEGRVHLLGRVTDLLNIAGRKASPESIEAILRGHPAVRECVVFGIPAASHERTDTVVAAVNTDSAIPISELTAFLSQKMPGWQIPRHWWFTGELAPNQRGKIPRAEWKRRYLENQSLQVLPGEAANQT